MALIFREEDSELLTYSPITAGWLLADSSDTGDSLSAGRLRLGAGTEGGKPHRHARSSELFYVLDGTLEILLDDEVATVGKGGLVVVPPLMPHAFSAAPGTHADLFIAITPGVERFDYLRHLQRMANGGAPADHPPEHYDVHPTESPLWTKRQGTTR